MHRRRSKVSRRLWWTIPLALASPTAAAAVFTPGVEADPPTGDVTAAVPNEAAEPLLGGGIQWQLARGRFGSALAMDGRWFRYEDGPRNQQMALSYQFDWFSYIWQPWFVQLQAGLGVVGARDRINGGDGGEDVVVADTTSMTGRFGLQLFPSSRFPFDFYADVSDNRAGGDALSGVLRTQRMWLTQSYQPSAGSQNYMLRLNYSRLETTSGNDTLYTAQAQANVQAGNQQFDADANVADNRLDGNGQHTRVMAVSGHHGYYGGGAINTDTVLNWNNVKFNGAPTGDGNSVVSSDVRQLASVLTWYPLAGTLIAEVEDGAAPSVISTNGPLLVTGAARYSEAAVGGDFGGPLVRAMNVSVGASQDLSPAWRIAASASANRIATDESAISALGGRATATWAPVGMALDQWRYMPTLSASVGVASESGRGTRHFLGGQAGQSLSRDMPLGPSQMISTTLSQSYGVLRESETARVAQALANTVGVAWQAFSDGGSQQYASLSVSDSRAWSDSNGSFQMVNLQVSQRSQWSRFNSISIGLTAQATNSSASVLDPFTGVTRTLSNGWQTFYSGSGVLEQLNVFGVPRLRHTLLLSVASQQLQSRAFGDIEAPTQLISESLESRLDWIIGRLQARLSARFARVDGQRVAGIVMRVQRNF